jgi:putative NIF3 family GTP cyclohydrolase 1 type 2
MKVKDILDHFLSRADWVDRQKTVDRVIFGDPEEDVSSCLVTWMPSFDALRILDRKGLKLMICHEPVFWDHHDKDPDSNPRTSAKLGFIRSKGLTVLRIHDSWDRWPDLGIPFAWARFLGFEGAPTSVGANGYQHRYDVDPITVGEIAMRIAGKCAKIAEPLVQVTGDMDAEVSRIGIGTGCGCSIEAYMDMGCDCSVVCDDGSSYWAGIQMARDLDHPVIRVNHGTSEEPGMVTLTDYVNDSMEGVEAKHLPHGCSFRLTGP